MPNFQPNDELNVILLYFLLVRISNLNRSEMGSIAKESGKSTRSEMLSQLQNTLRKRRDRKSLEAKYLAMAKAGK